MKCEILENLEKWTYEYNQTHTINIHASQVPVNTVLDYLLGKFLTLEDRIIVLEKELSALKEVKKVKK